jgi:diacylglycerol kinase
MKNPYYQNVSFRNSIRHATDGLKAIFRDEKNFRNDLVIALLVIMLGILLEISHFDWIAISLVISMVLVSEAMNSVIEAMCDTVSHEFKVNIKYAKDVSAGAVLLSACVSVITGLVVFIPYIMELISSI